MLKIKLYTICVLSAWIVLPGCSTPSVITVWKNEHAFPGKYNKIMVTGIVNIDDTSLRAALENHFEACLDSMGYHAVSSLAQFGPKGLHDLGQEDTYIVLCNKGIDAVLIVALTISNSEISPGQRTAFTSPANYYYQRIWQYKEQQLQLPGSPYDSLKKYYWETILFDLSTLQPHYIMQTKQFTDIRKSIDREFWKDVIKKLTKEKYLKKQPVIDNTQKAF